jgi:hypothetical protein
LPLNDWHLKQKQKGFISANRVTKDKAPDLPQLHRTLSDNLWRSDLSTVSQEWSPFLAAGRLHKIGGSTLPILETQKTASYIQRARTMGSFETNINDGQLSRSDAFVTQFRSEKQIKQRSKELISEGTPSAEVVNAVRARLTHVRRCFDSLGKISEENEGGSLTSQASAAFEALNDTVLVALEHLEDAEKKAKADANEQRRLQEQKQEECDNLRKQLASSKNDMIMSLKQNTGELNEKWRREKAKLCTLSDRLSERLRQFDEMHPDNPMHELREEKAKLMREVDSLNSAKAQLRVHLLDAKEKLDAFKIDSIRKQEELNDTQDMHLTVKERLRNAEIEILELKELNRMASEEVQHRTSVAHSFQFQLRLAEKYLEKLMRSFRKNSSENPTIVFDDAGRPGGVWENAVAAAAYDSEMYAPEWTKSERLGKLLGEDVQLHPVRQVTLPDAPEDPRSGAKGSESGPPRNPVERMETELKGFRRAMCGAKREPLVEEKAEQFERAPGATPLPLPSMRMILQKNVPVFSLETTRAYCRAIFDAKAIETLYAGEQYSLIVPLPEFVFAWFEKWEIKDGGEILERDNIIADNDNIVISMAAFSCSLQQYRHADGGWEIHTAAAFLFEELPPDALAFFLTARYVLFEGPEVRADADLTCSIRYAPMGHAQRVLATLLDKTSMEEKGTFFELLHEGNTIEGKKGKSGKSSFDESKCAAPLFLRMLLEEYMLERAQRLMSLDSIVSLALEINQEEFGGPGGSDTGLSLEQTIVILRAIFPSICASAEASLGMRVHRTAWALGNGIVNCASLRLAIESLGVVHLTLRLPLHHLSSKGLQVIGEAKESIQNLLRKTRDRLGKNIRCPLGPINRLLDLMPADDPAESLREYLELALSFVRAVTHCKGFFVVKPAAAHSEGVAPQPPFTMDSYEAIRWKECFESLLGIIRNQLSAEPPSINR